MHYYAVLYLCLAAGLEPGDAVKVAYSSQYVDDSVYSAKVAVIFSDGSKKVFDPIRSAHNGLKSFGAGVQEKVYFPFHFLPGMQGESYEEMAITQPGSKNILFDDVIKEALKTKNLYRIGISLHVLADTFSHEGFSGLWSQFNHADDVRFMPSKNSWWKAIGSKLRWRFGRNLFHLAPAIGHGKAGHLPDIPYLGWSYQTFEEKLRLVSNNLKFCNCLWLLYKKVISKIPGAAKKNARVSDDQLRKVLWEGVMQNKTRGRRCNYWRSEIEKLIGAGAPDSEVTQKYSDTKWLKKIGKMRKRFLFLKSRFKLKVSEKEFMESDYFKFHEQALKHRQFIMEKTAAEFSKMSEEPGFEDFRMSIQMIDGDIKQTREKKILI